jgi:tetratricopeptide (TPR) repeat protein
MIECTVGSPYDIRRHAEQTVALASEHGFPFHLAWGLIYRGWSKSRLGESEEGYSLIAKGLSMHRATGSALCTAFALTLLAEACNRLGRTPEGLSYLTEAEQIIETTNDASHEAELHRVRGDLLNANADVAGAERSYQQAIAVAKRQSAKMFELRACTSLARIWRDQGKLDEAREPSRSGLRLVHRRLRHARSEGSRGIARRAGIMRRPSALSRALANRLSQHDLRIDFDADLAFGWTNVRSHPKRK